MKTYCENNSGATYWDYNPLVIDWSRGLALASMIATDGLHDSVQGAQTKGKSAWNLLKLDAASARQSFYIRGRHL
jgi:hypothetical protein